VLLLVARVAPWQSAWVLVIPAQAVRSAYRLVQLQQPVLQVVLCRFLQVLGQVRHPLKVAAWISLVELARPQLVGPCSWFLAKAPQRRAVN
jgi:hypothetical protein